MGVAHHIANRVLYLQGDTNLRDDLKSRFAVTLTSLDDIIVFDNCVAFREHITNPKAHGGYVTIDESEIRDLTTQFEEFWPHTKEIQHVLTEA
jgi:hypothetical protein